MTGIIIGRFQVPTLTKGHETFLDWAAKTYDTLAIGLGCSAVQDERNPLPFPARAAAIRDHFGGFDLETYPAPTIFPVVDIPTDHVAWAKALDQVITHMVPDRRAEMIGGRDSFLEIYVNHGGEFPYRRCPIEIHSPSGTATRLALQPKWDSSHFRAGYLYARQTK